MTALIVHPDVYGDDKWLSISFPYDAQIVQAIKDLPATHREWDKPSKRWRVKIGSITGLVATLKAFGHTVHRGYPIFSKSANA